MFLRRSSAGTAGFPIATESAAPRDACRLLIIDRNTSVIKHSRFCEILSVFKPGDCLVLNASKVFPARLPFIIDGKPGDCLLAAYPKNGNAVPIKIESRHLRRLRRRGGRVVLKNGKEGRIEITGFDEVSGAFLANIELPGPIEDLGEIPLPPYIARSRRAEGLSALNDSDIQNYQCVYAEVTGSAACPTAGLHWTPELLRKLRAKGIRIVKLALHVGLASIVHGVGRSKLPPEEAIIDAGAAQMINEARDSGGRIVACGTSSVRALESAAGPDGRIRAFSGPVGIFIKPGFQFRAADAMITNFHLPDSTNFLMTQAFLERDGCTRQLSSVYLEASARGYRFYSYGDAMLIL